MGSSSFDGVAVSPVSAVLSLSLAYLPAVRRLEVAPEKSHLLLSCPAPSLTLSRPSNPQTLGRTQLVSPPPFHLRLSYRARPGSSPSSSLTVLSCQVAACFFDCVAVPYRRTSRTSLEAHRRRPNVTPSSSPNESFCRHHRRHLPTGPRS